MKKLLRQILKDKLNGYVLSHHQAIMIQGEWLKLFGTGGCDCYPYTTEKDMLDDLLDHYKVKQ